MRLDRRFEKRGPLVNRLLMGTVTGALQVDGKPLPPSRRAETRARHEQQALRQRLDPAIKPLWDADTLAALVAAVSGRASADTIGLAAQQAVGRLFLPHYVGSRKLRGGT